MIERFETTLRNLHLGIETWVYDSPLYSDEGTEVDHNEVKMGEVSVDTQLGFSRRAGEWGLAVRTAVYRRDEEDDWELLRVGSEFPLRDASRELRIEALGLFPQLLSELNDEVQDVIKEIQAARQFVELC